MIEITRIILALIEQIPWFAATAIIFMAGKFGFKHITFKSDSFECKLDKQNIHKKGKDDEEYRDIYGILL